MKCEIISIGSEITSGQNLDTNSQWLSQRLAEDGIAVGWHTTVADDFDANLDVFRSAARRAGLVQAMFPTGAEPIPNDWGTAPGVWMKLDNAWVAAMPGVPSEMFQMYEQRVRHKVLALGLGGAVLLQRKINTFGAGESQVEEKVADLTRRGHVPEVGITAGDATISLRILARGATRAAALEQAAPIEATIRERLGEMGFGVEAEDLHDSVVALLAAKRKTLATAEGVNAGL